jgi:hypothetical protein
MPRTPQTLQDWIMLMQAAKEKFGNLEVKIISNDLSIECEEFAVLNDIIIHGSVSLIDDDSVDDDKRFVIVFD